MAGLTITVINAGALYSAAEAIYADAHNAANAYTIRNHWSNLTVGQHYYNGNYWVYRICLVFDLSSVPDGTVFSAATLSLYGHDDQSTTAEFDITIVSGDDLADTFVAADFGELLDEITSYGTLNTTSFVVDDWNEIDLNATGLIALQSALSADVVRFGIRSSRDISNTTPKLNGETNYPEEVTVRGEFAGVWAKLAITYSVPPTVTTQAVTDILPTTATGNGNVTDLGDTPVTQHGHCWNTTGTPTTTDDKTEKGAAAATGPFSSDIAELTPEVNYYVRAYAINSGGTSYGNEVEFTAARALPTVTTNPATNVKEPSATLNGILDDEGEEACEVRFQYGLTTDYGTNTAWQPGKETGNTFSQAIVELVGGNLYHFRAQARNSAGTANGNDRTLATITPFVPKRAYALSREEL